jgi:large subunit ribosomal protein L29
VDQLSDELAKLKKEQFNLRFQRRAAIGEHGAVRVVRRDIARIMTVLQQARRAAPLRQQLREESAAKRPAKKTAAQETTPKNGAKRASAKK